MGFTGWCRFSPLSSPHRIAYSRFEFGNRKVERSIGFDWPMTTSGSWNGLVVFLSFTILLLLDLDALGLLFFYKEVFVVGRRQFGKKKDCSTSFQNCLNGHTFFLLGFHGISDLRNPPWSAKIGKEIREVAAHPSQKFFAKSFRIFFFKIFVSLKKIGRKPSTGKGPAISRGKQKIVDSTSKHVDLATDFHDTASDWLRPGQSEAALIPLAKQ